MCRRVKCLFHDRSAQKYRQVESFCCLGSPAFQGRHFAWGVLASTSITHSQISAARAFCLAVELHLSFVTTACLYFLKGISVVTIGNFLEVQLNIGSCFPWSRCI